MLAAIELWEYIYVHLKLKDTCYSTQTLAVDNDLLNTPTCMVNLACPQLDQDTVK